MSFGSGFGGGSPNSDTFYLYPTQNAVANGQRFAVTAGRTPVADQGLVSGESTLVVIFDGQSLWSSSVNSAYSVTQARNHNFSILDGAIYPMAEPVLGANFNPAATGAVCADIGDRAIVGGYCQRFISVPIAIGNTTWAQHADRSSPPFLLDAIGVTARRLSAKGLSANAVVIGLGENDQVAGTSQASIEASRNIIIAEYRAVGITCPLYVLRESMNNGSTSSAVRAAQASSTGTNVYVGFDMDTNIPNSGANRYDGTHLTGTGRSLAAAGVLINILSH